MIRLARRLAAVILALLLCADVAGAPLSPGIFGTYFNDLNMDGQVSPGEAIPGLSLQLFRDDGDGIFNPGLDTPTGDAVTTGAMGQYGFADLPDAGYFVQQSGSPDYLPNVTGLISPGDLDVLIDDFSSETTVDGNNINPGASESSPHAPQGSPLSGVRKVQVGMLSGVGDTRVLINPFGLESKLIYSTSAGVTGTAQITWDYAESTRGSELPNLSPIDLTQDGERSGLMLRIGVDEAGSSDLFKVRLLGLSDDEFSEAEAEVPTTDGFKTEFVFVPFSDFTGSVDATQAYGVELELGNGAASVDAAIDEFGVLGPKIRNVAVEPSVPEPTSLLIASVGILFALLAFRDGSRSRRP